MRGCSAHPPAPSVAPGLLLMTESARPMRAAAAAVAAISLLVLGLVELSRPSGEMGRTALEESYLYGAPGMGRRGRALAPGVHAIEARFEQFYQKGLKGEDETRVDLPLQHFSVSESGVRLKRSLSLSNLESS